MTFNLTNCIIYDILGKEPITNIKYRIDVKLESEGDLIQEFGPPVNSKPNKQ